ncbi:MAG: hypothetical protein A4E62_02369 [Syntrophorhabdus sp. PtaU1.Bin002]|nr:MAG: hypothetical protein A4E58_00081 [Syntrophorhabdus sp. PtaB.Bin006]OPY67015.1 MAG: hypothetical protein A4E62_02369 [Syntrophorhabdus sp. PtaU1.Bin002]
MSSVVRPGDPCQPEIAQGFSEARSAEDRSLSRPGAERVPPAGHAATQPDGPDRTYGIEKPKTDGKQGAFDTVQNWQEAAKEIFLTPSKGVRGEKICGPSVDCDDGTSSRASQVPRPEGRARSLPGVEAANKQDGSTLLDYRVTQAELGRLTGKAVRAGDAYGYRYKFVISGDIIELYSYEKPQYHGKKKKPVERKEHSKEERGDMRRKNYMRTAKTCRRLINANIGRHGAERGKFLTFTFREDIRDFKTANYEWKKFIQRLEYRIGCQLRYVVVPEFQDKTRDGVIHFHAIFFNLPFIPATSQMDTRGLGYNLADIWGLGFIKINAIDNVDNVGSYVTAYMTEDFEDERYQGAKKYFASRGLYKPEEFVTVDDGLVSEAKKVIEGERTYEATFENEYVGRVHYEQFNKRKGGCSHEEEEKREAECLEREQKERGGESQEPSREG